VAIVYDMRDPERVTRFSDNAFWLHLVSAPLIINGLGLVLGALQVLRALPGFKLPFPMPIPFPGEEWKVMVMIGLLTVIGLALNRRALVASSLGYAAMAIGLMVRNSNVADRVADGGGSPWLFWAWPSSSWAWVGIMRAGCCLRFRRTGKYFRGKQIRLRLARRPGSGPPAP